MRRMIALVGIALGIALSLLGFLGVGWSQAPLPPVDPLAQCKQEVLVHRDQTLQLQRIIATQLQRLTEYEQRILDVEKAANAPKPAPAKAEEKKDK